PPCRPLSVNHVPRGQYALPEQSSAEVVPCVQRATSRSGPSKSTPLAVARWPQASARRGGKAVAASNKSASKYLPTKTPAATSQPSDGRRDCNFICRCRFLLTGTQGISQMTTVCLREGGTT